jgi:hypothetical protein
MKNKSFYCTLCKKNINLKGLGNHIKNSHKDYTLEEYYDKFIDSSKHLCSCGKKLKFRNTTTGYRKTCGNNKCKQKLYSKAYFEKTGYINPFANPEIIKNREQILFEKIGYKNAFEDPNTVIKIKQIKKQKYGDENYCNTEQIKKTKYERYGDENYMCYGSQSFKNLMFERYDDENYSNYEKVSETWSKKTKKEIEEINFKKIKTTFERHGVLFGCELQEDKMYSKISQELFWRLYNKLDNDLKSNAFFKELNKELCIYCEDFNKICFVDFCIPEINFCLEFYGDYWHRNPKFYNDKKSKEIWKKDLYREDALSQAGFMIYKIWESQYKNNADFWIKEILFLINILKENR